MADAAPAMALALVDGRALLTVAARDLGPCWSSASRSSGPARGRRWRSPSCATAAVACAPPPWSIDRARHRDQVAAAQLPTGVRWAWRSTRSSGASPGGATERRRSRRASASAPARGASCKSPSTLARRDRPTCARRWGRCSARRPRATPAFEIDPLALALDEIFVADGFRLPDSGDLRLGVVRVSAGRIAHALELRRPAGDRRAADRRRRRGGRAPRARSTRPRRDRRGPRSRICWRPPTRRPARRRGRWRRFESASTTPRRDRWSARPGVGWWSSSPGAAIRTRRRAR